MRVAESYTASFARTASRSAGSDDAQSMLDDIGALRRRVVDAWKDRGVALTREEQVQLRDAIRETCSLLTDLTASS